MALGRNHRIFNIGNSSGSYGISRVYHDETLSGDGTLSSLLGVVGGAGDAEVNEFVYNNSGDIIDVNNVVQSNSANWDSPDLSEYIKFGRTDISDNDVSATFEVNSGWGVGRPKLVYSAHSVNGFNSNFIWKDGSELLLSANDEGSLNRYVNIGENGIEFSSYNPQASGKYGAEESEYLHSISSTIGDISGDISNKLDASSFDPNEFYPMTGNPSGFLTAVDLSDVVLNSAINYCRTDYGVSGISGRKLYAISSTYAALDEHGHSLIEPYNYINNNSARIGDVVLNYEQTSASYVVVNNNSANWNDISAYQQNSANYLTAHQSLDGYATTAWVEEQGYLTAHQDISNKLDVSSFSDVSGTFLTAVPAGYATTGEVNSVSSILSAAIDAHSGNVYTGIDPIVVNNDDKAISANTWAFSAGDGISFVDDNVNKITRIDVTAQGGVSPSGFVSGSNVLFVPNEYIPGQGKVYSANIVGDITVNYGDYYNSGENINLYSTYSLSSIGSQIGDKLNKSVIEYSKTLSIIDDNAEVYSFAYKPSEFVTTGITVENYSSPNSVHIQTSTQYPYRLYSTSLVIESDGFDENYIPDDWNFVDSANGSATFSRFYKNEKWDEIYFSLWPYSLTNASAYSVACRGFVKDALAFKSDLTGGDVSSYATRSEVNNVSGVLETEIQAVSSNIPDISGLATKQELNVVSGMIPDVSGFVTETTLETVSGNIVNQIPDVSNYATTQALESASGALNSKIDAVSGAIPDVSNFATETELQAVSAAIPTVTLQSLNTANITDIQLVDAASACTGANILYLIPEA